MPQPVHRDFKELLSVSNDEKVRFLVVGGYAVSLHTQPGATEDTDVEAIRKAQFRQLRTRQSHRRAVKGRPSPEAS